MNTRTSRLRGRCPMAKNEPSGCGGCLVAAGLLLAVPAFFYHWGLGVVSLIAVGALANAVGHSGRCDVCGIPLKRSAHRWTIEGKSARVCPNCNARLAKHQSDAAFGKGSPIEFMRPPGGMSLTARLATGVISLGVLMTCAIMGLIALGDRSPTSTPVQPSPTTAEATVAEPPKTSHLNTIEQAEIPAATDREPVQPTEVPSAEETAKRRAEVEENLKAQSRARDGYRVWKDATGSYTVEAKFGGIGFGKVTLIKVDGSKVLVPIERLSAEDQQWLEDRRKNRP